MKALILIGGLGTRLRPLTCSVPKPLLPVVNRPFLDYQLALLKYHKITEVIFALAYLPDQFRQYYGDGRKWGMKIRYCEETDPLGTGGAVKNAEKYLDERVIILNGDVLVNVDITKLVHFHKHNKAKVTIALTRVKDPTMFGLVETDRQYKIERFLEKPSWDEVTCNTVNAGIYLFEPDVLQMIPKNEVYSLERGLFPHLLENKESLYGYVFNGYWLDIGTIEKYLQAHFDILEHRSRFSYVDDFYTQKLTEIHTHVWSEKGVKIGQHLSVDGKMVVGKKSKIADFVQIKGMVSVGNNCQIGQGTVLNNCVVLDNTIIGEGNRLENCIIGRSCQLEPDVILSPKTVLADNSILKRYSRL